MGGGRAVFSQGVSWLMRGRQRERERERETEREREVKPMTSSNQCTLKVNVA